MLRLAVSLLLVLAVSNTHARLFAAVQADDLQQVESLLANGAEVDERDTYGQTPLMYALDNGASVAVVRALLSAGADPNALTSAQWSPAMYAVRSGHIANMLALVRADGDLRANTSGAEPLSLAPNYLVLTVGVLASYPLVNLSLALAVYFVLRSRRLSRFLARRISGPVLLPHEWREADRWGRERSRKSWARISVLQPLLAVGGFAAVWWAGYSLMGEGSGPPMWEILLFSLSLPWAIGAFFVLLVRRLKEHGPYLVSSVRPALRPLGPVVSRLGEGWYYRFERLGPESRRDVHAVVLTHVDTSNSNVLLMASPASGDLSKERGEVDDADVAALLALEAPAYRNEDGSPITVRRIVYAPHASASEFNDKLSVRGGWVFAGDAAVLVEQLEGWQTVEHQKAQEAREREEEGKRVEADAIADATATFPAEWKIQPNFMLPTGGGDVDLLVFLPSQRRYVIDIKSHRGDPTNQGSDKDWDAVLEQLRRQARELAAEPIVWQPRATRQKVIRVAEVAYVPGDASELRAYLEMRGGLGAAAD